MPIGFQDGAYMLIPDHCPQCDRPAYDSGCGAPGCLGMGCRDCNWGCDLDFVDEADSRCARASAAEDREVQTRRLSAERAAFALGEVDRGYGDSPESSL